MHAPKPKADATKCCLGCETARTLDEWKMARPLVSGNSSPALYSPPPRSFIPHRTQIPQTCLCMFTTASFVTDKTWKVPRCLLAFTQASSGPTQWRSLRLIRMRFPCTLLSGRSQSARGTCCIVRPWQCRGRWGLSWEDLSVAASHCRLVQTYSV